MEKSFSFIENKYSSSKNNIDVSLWDDVMKAWEEKQYEKCLRLLLCYIKPEVEKDKSDSSGNCFKVNHGSIVLDVGIKNNQLHIDTPFLDVSKANKVALFRQVAQINFSPFNLAEIVLESNQLNIHYQSPIELCEPYKIYDVFYEICINADRYDDQFIRDFNAEWINQPKIKKYSEQQYDTILKQLNVIIDECMAYVDYFESNRNFGFAWDTLNIALKRIDYCISPQGTIRNRIEDTISFMENKGNYMEQIGEAKKFLLNLSTLDKSSLITEIYDVDIFIPYKYRGNLESVKNNLSNNYVRAREERGKNNFVGSCLTMLYSFYHLLYTYNIHKDLKGGILGGIEESSQKGWVESSNILWKTLDEVMQDRPLSYCLGRKKGFFSKLFGF